MSITNFFYRKNIGEYNNHKNQKAPSHQQQQLFINRLSEMPAHRARYDNASLWLKIILLLTNAAQLSQGASLSASTISKQLYLNESNDLPIPKKLIAIVNVKNNPTAIIPKQHSIYYYSVDNKDEKHLTSERLNRRKKKSHVKAGHRNKIILDNGVRKSKSDVDGLRKIDMDLKPALTVSNSFKYFNKYESIKTFLNAYKNNYPNLFKVAADEIKKAIIKKTGLSLDPDKTYFHRFTSAQNDPASVTGWRHDSTTAIESRTLTECVLYNFSADARDNMDVVDQMTGIYNASTLPTGCFGGENQVPIKPSTVANLIIEMDFFNLYIYKLNKYWQTDIPEYIFLAQFFLEISQPTQSNKKYAGLFLQAFGLVPQRKAAIKKYLFDINGFKSTDIIIFSFDDSQHYGMYVPGKPGGIFYFHTLETMKTWFIKSCMEKGSREIIAGHFSIDTRQEGILLDGVNSWLDFFGEDADAINYLGRIWWRRDEITDDLVRFIVMQQKNRALSDADSLIKSNAEVRRDMAIKYFSIMNMLLPNPVTPFISLGLDIDKMVNGDDEPERKEAARLVLGDGINVALIAMGGLLEGRMSIAYNEGAEFRFGGMPVSEQLKNEMYHIDSAGPQTSGKAFSFEKNFLYSIRDEINDKITFHKNVLTNIDKLDIKGVNISTSALSKINNFGIFHDAVGDQYLKIKNAVYQIKPAGHPGYYFLGEKNNIGIIFNKKLNRYRLIDLEKLRLTDPIPCKTTRSISIVGNRLCLPQFSPQVRRILARHIEINPLYDYNESAIVYDRDGNFFRDRANNQKYILFSNRYFPVEDIENGFVIYKPGEHGHGDKLTRVYFSLDNKPSYLITRMERIGEIFSQALIKPDLLKMRNTRPLNAHERQALADFQYKNMRQVNEALHKRVSTRHRPVVIDSDVLRQIENIHSALAKMKPAQCTVVKIGRMQKRDFLKLKPNDVFMAESFMLAGLKKPVGKDINLYWNSEEIPVEFSVQLKNRGYPINLHVGDVSDIAILVKDKTFFRTTDIQGLKVSLKEISSYDVRKYTSSLNEIRSLNVDVSHDGIDSLKKEVHLMQGLLKNKYSSLHNAPEYMEKYSKLLYGLAEKQIYSSALEEYTEAGSDFINDWLRFGTRSKDTAILSADEEAAELLSDYDKMHDFNGYAFRVAEYPRGVYGQAVQEGDIVADKGFMSASALPVNCVGWKEGWTRQFSKTRGDQIIVIFDKNVPKKIAGTGFLIDHILVKPRTPLNVVSITPADDLKGNPVLIVSVSRAKSARRIKDIFTGKVII
ncbi:dermonecrotic toxin domain-containing protein [Sodalis sp. RH16]|uniref:dermonecrotic toxin domain-containing protein n=1 Tax=Sodalis sp. RH16 TaxID=3394331 RepID=UPI0039B64EE6